MKIVLVILYVVLIAINVRDAARNFREGNPALASVRIVSIFFISYIFFLTFA